jgi:ribosomal protein S7
MQVKTSKSSLYLKLLGALIKNGHKLKAKKIIDEAFFYAGNTTLIPLDRILLKLFLVLNTFVETKTLSIKRRSYTIPFAINLKRRIYLAISWLLKAVSENKKRLPFSIKLGMEIHSILKSKSSLALRFKKLNCKQAILNRANIHYRW